MKRLFIILLLASMTISCTENSRARAWGGKVTLELKPGQQLMNAAWKETDLWLLTKERPDSVDPKTYQFSEKSTFGVMEGVITIKEK